MVEKNLKHARQILEANFPLIYSMKSLIVDLTTILLPKRLILLYCLIAKVMYYQNLLTFVKSSLGCSSGWKSESP